MANIRKGAALEFTESELGGPCTENDSNPVAAVTVSTAVLGNGDRVGLLIMNLGANNVFVGLTPNVSATNGIFLAPNGGFISLDVEDDYTLQTRQWFMLAIGGNSQMYVLEINRFALTPGGTTP